ncbi:DUF2085 domain-containing protein [Bacillus sp. EB600]|uniref:DUF2085 domain-containing protein n=1 Tax=Bacillus sp. EB600 TaxID=2806345 RepID=UPI00210E6227|nr:DUF2085 domain-containing protein [Bacillus sp. EB600]MCQ6281696.1 DUF2085 domain-containing protein [Bacillus sp. EB600]
MIKEIADTDMTAADSILEGLIVVRELFHDIITLQFVPCHRRKYRTICINGKYFPICSRCMSVLLGYLFLIPLLLFHIHVAFWLGIVLNIPMVVDGYTQWKRWHTSNNTLRVITGLSAGIGQSISFLLIHLLTKA